MVFVLAVIILICEAQNRAITVPKDQACDSYPEDRFLPPLVSAC